MMYGTGGFVVIVVAVALVPQQQLPLMLLLSWGCLVILVRTPTEFGLV